MADAGADQTVTADTSCRAVVALDGTHMITLTVRDRRGGSSSDTLVVSVVDATPPVIQSAATPSVPVAGEAAVRRRHYRCVCFAFLPR